MNTENLIETNDSGILWQTFSLPSSCPGENVFCRLAQPQTPFRGIVQISHGMCEYIDRYLPFFRFLAKEGFVVCGNDHLGLPSAGGGFAQRFALFKKEVS